MNISTNKPSNRIIQLFKQHNYQILTIFLLIFSLLNNLFGIHYGLPFTYDPDEPTFVTAAGAILANRDLNPHWFGHPGSTTIYMLSAVYALIFVIGYLLGIFKSPEDFRLMYHDDATLTYLSGRLLMVIFSVAVVFLISQIGKRLFNPKVGLMAGLITALSPLYVNFSKFIRTDIIVTFFILLSLWFCINYHDRHRWRDLILAGIFNGLAVATKYPAVIFSFILLLVVFNENRTNQKKLNRLIASASASLAGAFIGSPFLFLDFKNAIKDVLVEARTEHLSHTGAGFFENFIWYLQDPLAQAFTIGGLSLALLGLGIVILEKKQPAQLIAIFPIIFLVFISFLSLRWDRWVIPMIPFLALLLAFAVHWIASHIAKVSHSETPQAVGLLILGAVCLPLGYQDYQLGASLSGPPTRTQAAEWMQQNIPADTNVLMEIYGPILPKYTFNFFVVDSIGQMVNYDPDGSYKNNFSPSGHIGDLDDYSSLANENISYVVLTQMYDRYKAEESEYHETVSRYEEIMASGKLVYQVAPLTGFSAGPPIRIYALP